MRDRIVQDLGRLFAGRLHIEIPSPETDLIETGLLDSLRLVELLLYIESDLGWRLPIEDIDLDDLRSVRHIAALIESRTQLEQRVA